jgi:hypothetical protein
MEARRFTRDQISDRQPKFFWRALGEEEDGFGVNLFFLPSLVNSNFFKPALPSLIHFLFFLEKELQARDLEQELLVRDFVVFPSRDQSIVIVKKDWVI